MVVLLSCSKHTVAIPHAEQIEMRAIDEVANFKNVIVEIKRMSFGGGVGVGVGSPEIQCTSEQQFLSLISDSTRIFTSVIKLDDCTVARRYLSPSALEGLLYTYDATVRYKNWGVYSFNADSVTFRHG